MTRIAIETLVRELNAAYRADPFCSLRGNLKSVRPEEWDIRPATWQVAEFGNLPELSIGDIVAHVAGAKFMYADRAFGDASLEWAEIALPPTRDMETMLAWLDEGHRTFAEGLAALQNDDELAAERPAPWRLPMRRDQLISIIISHDLYHSGEINRQRALIRGAEGWSRAAGPP
jgi:hypothetical protein